MLLTVEVFPDSEVCYSWPASNQVGDGFKHRIQVLNGWVEVTAARKLAPRKTQPVINLENIHV